FGSIKGFSENSPYADLKVYDNVAQCAGGAASTTGFWDGPPTVSGGALGDRHTGMHLLIGILTALIDRNKTGSGQKVSVSMQDAVLNLCRVKLRDQQRLENVGYQEQNWTRTADAIGHPEWRDDPGYATPRARADKIFEIFAEIEKWLADKTKFEGGGILRGWGGARPPVPSP